MKHIKLVLLVLVLGFIFLFFYQNQEYLLTTHAFTIDIYLTDGKLPALATGFYIVFAFLLGAVVMFVYSLFPRFRSTKELKQLRQEQAQVERLRKENSELLDNLCVLREQSKPETPVTVPSPGPEQADRRPEPAQANPSLPEPEKKQTAPN